jgi:hypothetical protein
VSSANASAALEQRTDRPLLRVQRPTDGAGRRRLHVMLAASAVLIGSFLVSFP